MEKQIWKIELNVKDIETQIELPSWTWYGCSLSNSKWRAERMAIRAYKNLARSKWCAMVCNKYRLTRRQLERLVDDRLITPPDLFEVTVANVENCGTLEA